MMTSHPVHNQHCFSFRFFFFFKVYDTAEGTMVDMLKGHRDTVYCLAYESSGKTSEGKSGAHNL